MTASLKVFDVDFLGVSLLQSTPLGEYYPMKSPSMHLATLLAAVQLIPDAAHLGI